MRRLVLPGRQRRPAPPVPQERRALQERVAANALELARNGLPRPPFYLAGQMGGQGFSLHAEGERVILTDAAGQRREVELGPRNGDRMPVLSGLKPGDRIVVDGAMLLRTS